MSLTPFESYSLIVAAISVVVAAVTFVLSEIRRRKADKELEIESWQQAIAYTIIQKAGFDGLSFDEVYRQYQTEAQNWEKHEIPSNKLNHRELRRVLLNLFQMNAIKENNEGKYTTSREPNWIEVLSFMKEMDRDARSSDDPFDFSSEKRIINSWRRNTLAMPGARTVDELVAVVASDTNFSAADIRLVLSDSHKSLGEIDENGRVFPITSLPLVERS